MEEEQKIEVAEQPKQAVRLHIPEIVDPQDAMMCEGCQ